MRDRRRFLTAGLAVTAAARAAAEPVYVPVHLSIDRDTKWRAGEMERFREQIWLECVRDFARSGVAFRVSESEGRVESPQGREPVISGLNPAALNVALTDRIPEEWDRGRAIAGVSAVYRGYHLCMIALRRARPHRFPFVVVNTCTHELLHAILLDILETKPRGISGEWRESRIDAIASKMWWFGDGGAVRESARVYVERLKASYYPRN